MNTLALLLSFLCCGALRSTGGQRVSRAGEDILYATAPQERGAYAVGSKGGRYKYGYNTGDGIAKVEVRQPDGSVVGSYRYFDPNGKQVVRSYTADNRGFRVLGNDLPISPDTPVSHLAGLPAFTGAVEGTDEFAIPPPLGTTALGTHHQEPLQHHLLQHQQFIQQNQEEYRRQQQKLEDLRRQLRELEEQQIRMQQQVQDSHTRHVHQQQHHYRAPQRYQAHQLHLTRNHLTHDYFSPYRVFQREIDYDFPAGFAYTGLPTLNASPSSRTRYARPPYTIGRER